MSRGQYGVGAEQHLAVGAEAIEPRFAARRRAVHAVFQMYTGAQHAPYYVYAEVNGIVDKSAWQALGDANARAFALEKSPGEVYVSVFAADDRAWPDPAFDIYYAAGTPRSTVAGDQLLYGGSLYSSPPWGGAPDFSSTGWPYHGARSFHGHEAPSYGRGGLWSHRREAPLGRGALVNGRGEYGDRVGQGFFGRGDRAIVGVHTPTEVDSELEELNGEIMSFGHEAGLKVKQIEDQLRADSSKLRDEAHAAWEQIKQWEPHAREVDRLREQIEQSTDMNQLPLLHAKLAAATVALDQAAKMARPDRKAAVAHAEELTARANQVVESHLRESPLGQWSRASLEPFVERWMSFYHQKKDVPAQTWPLSGAWDLIQDYRQQYIDIRAHAPFKSAGPTPLDPDSRRGGFFEDLAKYGKYALLGGLGLGGIYLTTKVVQAVRARSEA